MRVAVYYNNNDVRVEERPVPMVGPGEMLVRIMASGICGTDVMEWYRIKKSPLILGHEIAGEVVEVGDEVDRCKVGDRVAVAHHVPCNTCYYCLKGHHTVCDTLRKTNFDPGGFAEYVRLPAINVDRGVFPLPDKVSYEEATFIEPLACILRGQRKAGMEPGQSVLVIGSGISGLLHVKLACALGAGLVAATDISEYRLEAAKRFGASLTIQADDDVQARFREANNGRLADLVIVCTGATKAFTQALQSVERSGTILFFAPTEHGVTIPISINELFWRNDVVLTTSYAGSPADHMEALELIRAGRVDVQDMITHRLSLSESGKGFRLVAGARDCIKVIIEPQR
ncbi:MAG: zinc-dependent dehydrogenase [Nitrospirota bacterium]